jgi:hypothetical protein
MRPNDHDKSFKINLLTAKTYSLSYKYDIGVLGPTFGRIYTTGAVKMLMIGNGKLPIARTERQLRAAVERHTGCRASL